MAGGQGSIVRTLSVFKLCQVGTIWLSDLGHSYNSVFQNVSTRNDMARRSRSVSYCWLSYCIQIPDPDSASNFSYTGPTWDASGIKDSI
jgi:hypothetical protein